MNEKEKAFIESQQQYDLFYKTFGGTTFRHMITWFKLQVEQNKPRIGIYEYNFPHTGYYLKLREFRWNLPLCHEEKDGLKNTFEDFDFAYKVVSGKNYDDITIFENDSLSNKKIENIAILNSLKLLYQELKKYLYPIELVKLENSWYKHINHNLQ